MVLTLHKSVGVDGSVGKCGWLEYKGFLYRVQFDGESVNLMPYEVSDSKKRKQAFQLIHNDVELLKALYDKVAG